MGTVGDGESWPRTIEIVTSSQEKVAHMPLLKGGMLRYCTPAPDIRRRHVRHTAYAISSCPSSSCFCGCSSSVAAEQQSSAERSGNENLPFAVRSARGGLLTTHSLHIHEGIYCYLGLLNALVLVLMISVGNTKKNTCYNRPKKLPLTCEVLPCPNPTFHAPRHRFHRLVSLAESVEIRDPQLHIQIWLSYTKSEQNSAKQPLINKYLSVWSSRMSILKSRKNKS